MFSTRRSNQYRVILLACIMRRRNMAKQEMRKQEIQRQFAGMGRRKRVRMVFHEPFFIVPAIVYGLTIWFATTGCPLLLGCGTFIAVLFCLVLVAHVARWFLMAR